MIDLGALPFPPGSGTGEELLRTTESLEVEILGNGNGVTFALGNASIPLPEGQLQQKSSGDQHELRVSLVGAAGMRTGTLVGAFRFGGCMIRDPGDDVVAICGAGGGSAAAESLGIAASEPAGRGVENEVVSGEEPAREVWKPSRSSATHSVCLAWSWTCPSHFFEGPGTYCGVVSWELCGACLVWCTSGACRGVLHRLRCLAVVIRRCLQSSETIAWRIERSSFWTRPPRSSLAQACVQDPKHVLLMRRPR